MCIKIHTLFSASRLPLQLLLTWRHKGFSTIIEMMAWWTLKNIHYTFYISIIHAILASPCPLTWTEVSGRDGSCFSSHILWEFVNSDHGPRIRRHFTSLSGVPLTRVYIGDMRCEWIPLRFCPVVSYCLITVLHRAPVGSHGCADGWC